MVPADSHKVSRAPRYSGYHYHLYILPVLDYHYLRLIFPNYSSSIYKQITWSYNPINAVTSMVWAILRSLATTYRITIVFFSSAYLDVSVQQVRSSPYGGCHVFNMTGCPIRKSADHIVCANTHSLSQLITSFFASESLGIHHTPLISSYSLIMHLS